MVHDLERTMISRSVSGRHRPTNRCTAAVHSSVAPGHSRRSSAPRGSGRDRAGSGALGSQPLARIQEQLGSNLSSPDDRSDPEPDHARAQTHDPVDAEIPSTSIRQRPPGPRATGPKRSQRPPEMTPNFAARSSIWLNHRQSGMGDTGLEPVTPSLSSWAHTAQPCDS
jgi:hypothetical protein